MKTLVLTLVTVLMWNLGVSQITFVRSDSVDMVALGWLNKYRAYYKCKPVKMSDKRKTDAVRMSKTISDSVNPLGHCPTLKHTTEFCAEVLTVATFSNVALDQTTKLTTFIKTIFKKDLMEITGVDLVILTTLFNWENSPSHKKIITNPKYTYAYFSLHYQVNRPYQLKLCSPTDKEANEYGLFNYKDGGKQIRYLYAGSIQFEVPFN